MIICLFYTQHVNHAFVKLFFFYRLTCIPFRVYIVWIFSSGQYFMHHRMNESSFFTTYQMADNRTKSHPMHLLSILLVAKSQRMNNFGVKPL